MQWEIEWDTGTGLLNAEKDSVDLLVFGQVYCSMSLIYRKVYETLLAL